jgi:hypothetical protein
MTWNRWTEVQMQQSAFSKHSLRFAILRRQVRS